MTPWELIIHCLLQKKIITKATKPFTLLNWMSKSAKLERLILMQVIFADNLVKYYNT